MKDNLNSFLIIYFGKSLKYNIKINISFNNINQNTKKKKRFFEF